MGNLPATLAIYLCFHLITLAKYQDDLKETVKPEQTERFVPSFHLRHKYGLS